MSYDPVMEALKKLTTSVHESVLKQEVIDLLSITKGEWYIDGTFGGGGHTAAMLEMGANVLALDRDTDAISRGQEWRSSLPYQIQDRLILVQSRFSDMEQVSAAHTIHEVAGILLDLGLSSDQLDNSQRGFSFSKDGPIDMRMDQNVPVSAFELLHGLSESELTTLFRKYGELPKAGAVARAIVNAREQGAIETTTALRQVIEEAFGYFSRKVHSATLVFQALRIAVNDELRELETALDASVRILKPGGRLAVISFHSLEDRIVKHFMRDTENVKEITKKPIMPSFEEQQRNPRSRSAKLRVLEKDNEAIQKNTSTESRDQPYR